MTDSIQERVEAFEAYVAEAQSLCAMVREQRALEQSSASSVSVDTLLRESAIDEAHAATLDGLTEQLAERRVELQAQVEVVQRAIAVLGTGG